ncbi:uncharacterized protein LOC6573009 [Drosophila mojavensis]|uniref:Osiris 21 n=1 Tax=Drosophila mojavensis TaxID=7230 RepID=B4KA79_DROMO|nr:uncharacterized protein LOC6573009 [Drosophila mojavensis]EDW14566.1 uncharacterized protein Dmoj_GI24328 [Drosophila mojavensis]
MSRFVSLLTFLALCATLAGSQQQDTGETTTAASEEAARGLASSYEPEDRPTQRRNSHIYMGIYKNYKSTYLGNKTTSEYRKRLRERVSAAHLANNEAIEEPATEGDEYLVQRQQQEVAIDDALAQELRNEANAEALLEAQTDAPVYDENETAAGKKRRKRKRKNRNNVKKLDEQLPEAETELDEEPNEEADNVERYHVGPGLNVSLDMSNDIVRVKLDGENLKEILAARWLTADNSEEGRGKKYDMMTKVLPLFILPFLIQSAIVPFLVTKLKLLLVKSILVGKLAIFLLIISAIKNSNKMMQSYEVAPSYWASEPSRRSELAAAASSASAAYNGYRVEGKPTAWVN